MLRRDILYFRLFCVIFWLQAGMGVITSELIPSLSSLYRPMVLLCDPILVIMGLTLLKDRVQRILLLVFCAIAFVSSLVLNHNGVITTLNGARDFLPIIFGLPLIQYFFTCPHSAYMRESIDRQLYVFLILQAICITCQFFVYGACDYGGGTFGNGGSGNVSILIIIISFYFTSRNWDSDNYVKSLKRNLKYILLMYPVMLNETKVSFVFIALYFLLLFRFEIKSLVKLFIALPIAAAVGYGLVCMYSSVVYQDEDGSGDITSEGFVETYLTGGEETDQLLDFAEGVASGDLDEEGFMTDIPRFMRMGILIPLVGSTPGGYLFGVGLGQFRGMTMFETTAFFDQYSYFLSGSVTQFLIIYVQLGFLGFIWYLVWMFHAFRTRHNYGSYSVQTKLLLASVVIITLVYSPSMTSYPFVAILYIILCACSYPQLSEADKKKAAAAPPSVIVGA